MKQIMLKTYYDTYIAVDLNILTPEILLHLAFETKTYEKNYSDKFYRPSNTPHGKFEIIAADLSEFEEPTTINIEEIMAENNRLTRELELIKSQMHDHTDSKEVANV
jgi:hypothetical protein